MILAASKCINSGPSRLVYTLNPISLVYIGPNIDTALCELIAELIATLNKNSIKARHIATTYSLANIAILIDCFEPCEGIHLNFFRLSYRAGVVTSSSFDNERLAQRITNQLRSIQTHCPDLIVPFRCVESWQGIGLKDHPIYERMLEASSSLDKWRVFKDNLASQKPHSKLGGESLLSRVGHDGKQSLSENSEKKE